MSQFNWNDHPVVAPASGGGSVPPSGGNFSWDDHPVIQAAPKQDEPGFLERTGKTVFDTVAGVGRQIDRFTGAPVRAAIGAVQQGENPAEAYLNQFGANPESAPTGREIAQRAGIPDTALSDVVPRGYSKTGGGFMSDVMNLAPIIAGGPVGAATAILGAKPITKGGTFDPTASGVAGGGIDVAADPLNLLGVGEIADVAKAGLRGVGVTAGKTAEAAAKAADMATGTRAAETTVGAVKSAAETTGKVYEAAKDSIGQLLKPKLAEDAKDMASIAEKNGIAKELMSPAHEFGDESSITRLQRTIAEGALGQKYLESHNEGLLQTSKALEKQISGKFGSQISTDAEAGKILTDAVDNHISKVFDDADITFSSASKQFPGLQINQAAMDALYSKAVGMQREAARILRTSADPVQLSQAKNLMNWAELIQNAKGSYKEMAEIVQNVGKAAYAKTPLGQIPSDVRKLRELYDIGSESLIHSIRKVDQNAADRLIVNNQEIREMLGDKATLGSVLSNARTPEQVFRTLIKNGGSEQIEVLKKILPQETFEQLRGKYLGDMVKYTDADQNFVNFRSTRTALDKSKDRLAYLFAPEELKDTTDLLKFGERYGSPVMSSSGTGASSGIRGFIKNLEGAVMDENALEYMKNKARGQVPAESSTPLAESTPELASGGANEGRPLIRPRGPVESRLKVAQSVAPSTYQRPALPGKPSGGSNVGSSDQEQPEKGPDKWANDGIDKLKEHTRDPASIDGMKEVLLKDPKAKELLAQASDLKPGSKGMETIMERIRQRYGAATSKR